MKMLSRFTQAVMEKTMTLGFVHAVAAFSVLAGVAVTETVLHYRTAELASARKTAALVFASELRARADRELNSVLYLSSGLVGYLVVRHDRLDAEELGAVLGAVHGYGTHVRNLTVAVGYRVSYMFPMTGNDKMLGRDYRELTAQWPAVKLAAATRKPVLTGPVKLVQGGDGLIFRIPVIVGDRYWGMVSTVVDVESFVQTAFAARVDEHYEFAVRLEESIGPGGGMLWGKPELFSNRDAVFFETVTPNGKWIYAVRDKRDKGELLSWTIRGIGLVMSLLAGFGMLLVLQQRRALSELAGFDPLTGLPNRRLFDDRLDIAVRRLERKGQTGQVAVIFVDLDGFKEVNDRFGHKVGDAVLRTVGDRIREGIRPGDTVSRWAGDEFVVVIEDAISSSVEELADRLRQRIEIPMEIGNVSVSVFASVGVACYPGEVVSKEALLDLADRRMYEDKNARRVAGIASKA